MYVSVSISLVCILYTLNFLWTLQGHCWVAQVMVGYSWIVTWIFHCGKGWHIIASLPQWPSFEPWDRGDPDHFRTILNFLRNPHTPPMPRDTAESEALVQEQRCFWQIWTDMCSLALQIWPWHLWSVLLHFLNARVAKVPLFCRPNCTELSRKQLSTASISSLSRASVSKGVHSKL